MPSMRKGCVTEVGTTEQYHTSSIDSPDTQRFKGASKAAREWPRKHPNPLAFNRNHQRKHSNDSR